jgi:hypothetical protein
MGTRIDSTTKTGSYTNSFVVKLVANAIPYTIIYDDNVVSNMPTDISSTAPDSTINIASNTPTRAGYKFLGWCTVVPTNNNGTDTCTGGTTYQPSAALTIDQTGTGNNFHLYAMWQEEKTIANSTTMQEVNSCPDSLPTGQVYTIKDSRDNQSYKVAKLADGKCWLLDNLALDLTNSTVLNGMNENNTHASNTTLGYLKGNTTRDPSTDPSGRYATAGVSNWTSSYSYSAPLVNMNSKDVVPTSDDGTDDPMKDAVVAGNWKVGGYYNYCAASAGSYCYGYGTSSGTSSGDATSDICPKGWRMPTGNSGEYQTLYSNTNYNTYDKYREALRLPLSGYFDGGSANTQGSRGFWWSSTCYNVNRMYRLSADTSSINPAGNNFRYSGSSVRCVLGS